MNEKQIAWKAYREATNRKTATGSLSNIEESTARTDFERWWEMNFGGSYYVVVDIDGNIVEEFDYEAEAERYRDEKNSRLQSIDPYYVEERTREEDDPDEPTKFDIFVAGFMASARGSNGEYPFYDDEEKARNNDNVREKFEEVFDEEIDDD